jgi:hypothetical protein
MVDYHRSGAAQPEAGRQAHEPKGAPRRPDPRLADESDGARGLVQDYRTSTAEAAAISPRWKEESSCSCTGRAGRATRASPHRPSPTPRRGTAEGQDAARDSRPYPAEVRRRRPPWAPAGSASRMSPAAEHTCACAKRWQSTGRGDLQQDSDDVLGGGPGGDEGRGFVPIHLGACHLVRVLEAEARKLERAPLNRQVIVAITRNYLGSRLTMDAHRSSLRPSPRERMGECPLQ